MKPSALETRLTGALQSREERRIRRRLPDPATSPSPASQSATLVDFNSNDYLSLTTSTHLRQHYLQKLQDSPHILGSGGSRLLVNGQAHSNFEQRLRQFFCPNEKDAVALLFNSGYDANVGVFSCLPQEGDVVVYDEYIHASVHDGIRSSRAKNSAYQFAHNSLSSLSSLVSKLLAAHPGLRDGSASLFLAVESLYSMDGTFSPLIEINAILEEQFPNGNSYLIVDEAHSTGIYGPQGKGRVAELGLEQRCLVRLVTFGKALGASGAVVITNTLVRDYLLNYARSLIYTTSLSYASVIAADASFDLLEDGTASQLSRKLLDLSSYFTSRLQPYLSSLNIPASLLSLPSHVSLPSPLLPSASSSLPHSLATTPIPPAPIIPLLTHSPRALSAYLHTLGMNARPITWPTVPKGKDRVRICLHSGNTKEEVERLVKGCVEWALGEMRGWEDSEERERDDEKKKGGWKGGRIIQLQSKL